MRVYITQKGLAQIEEIIPARREQNEYFIVLDWKKFDDSLRFSYQKK